jgi:hypothetical protein
MPHVAIVDIVPELKPRLPADSSASQSSLSQRCSAMCAPVASDVLRADRLPSGHAERTHPKFAQPSVSRPLRSTSLAAPTACLGSVRRVKTAQAIPQTNDVIATTTPMTSPVPVHGGVTSASRRTSGARRTSCGSRPTLPSRASGGSHPRSPYRSPAHPEPPRRLLDRPPSPLPIFDEHRRQSGHGRKGSRDKMVPGREAGSIRRFVATRLPPRPDARPQPRRLHPRSRRRRSLRSCTGAHAGSGGRRPP